MSNELHAEAPAQWFRDQPVQPELLYENDMLMTLCSLELCGIRDIPVQYKLSIRVTGMSRMCCRIVTILSKTASEGKSVTSSSCSSLPEDAGVDVKLN